jgi:hypothetical protein
MKTILIALLLAASLAEATAGQLPCAPPLGRSDDDNCIRWRERKKLKPPPLQIEDNCETLYGTDDSRAERCRELRRLPK